MSPPFTTAASLLPADEDVMLAQACDVAREVQDAPESVEIPSGGRPGGCSRQEGVDVRLLLGAPYPGSPRPGVCSGSGGWVPAAAAFWGALARQH